MPQLLLGTHANVSAAAGARPPCSSLPCRQTVSSLQQLKAAWRIKNRSDPCGHLCEEYQSLDAVTEICCLS